MSISQKLKYRLTDESKIVHGVKVFRIEALRDIVYKRPAPEPRVLTGQKGGIVSNDQNLSYVGECWIAADAVAMHQAPVSAGAWLDPEAQARIFADTVRTTRLSGRTLYRERNNLHYI